jgi:ATP-dependent helicase/nuclease subunit B
VLTAKADRIDRIGGGGLVIIDYKTGRLPSKRELETGYSPQLPLEGAIATGGTFDGVGTGLVEALEYWRLTGGNPPGEIYRVDDRLETTAAALAQEARAGLENLVARFDRADTPYHARPRPQFAPTFSDYEHLARVKEWADEPDDER